MRTTLLIAAWSVIGCGGVVYASLDAPVDASVEAGDSRTPGEFDVDAYIPPEPDTGPAWDSRAGDAPPTNASCIACVAANCDSATCDADWACRNANTCRNACIDDACVAKCRERYPSPVFDVWWACVQSKCAGSCLM